MHCLSLLKHKVNYIYHLHKESYVRVRPYSKQTVFQQIPSSDGEHESSYGAGALRGPAPLHMTFVVHQVALAHEFSPRLHVLPFPLSVSSHQCSILIFIFILLYRRTSGKSRATVKQSNTG